jgi:hypothetical protein
MRSICLAAFVALAGCSFDPEKSDLTVNVVNISQSATDNVNHLDVTLTLPDGSTHLYHPTFGAQSTPSVVLSLATGGQIGPYTLTVVQANRNQSSPAAGGSKTVAGVLTPPQTTQQVDLAAP